MSAPASAERPPDPVSRRIRTLALVQLGVVAAIGASTLFLTAQITSLARQRADLRATLERESTALEAAKGERARVEREARALQAQKEQLQQQVEALQDRNLALRADLTTSEAAVSLLERAAPEATRRAFSQAAATPRVYMQVATPENEAVANRLRPVLSRAGYLVPRVERVPAVPRRPQVRYFSPGDENDASRLLALVKGALPEATLVLFGEGRKAGAMRPHHFEIWF
jgi:hypothetical protein